MLENGQGSDPVILPIEDSFDLHSFHPRDIPIATREYLKEAIKLGYKEVRIIHGRGRGYQRAVIHNLLAEIPQVVSYYDAPYERGGWGATVVKLK